MRNINVVAKKMARNGLKIANSLGCAFHFESDFNIKIFKPRTSAFLSVLQLYHGKIEIQ